MESSLMTYSTAAPTAPFRRSSSFFRFGFRSSMCASFTLAALFAASAGAQTAVAPDAAAQAQPASTAPANDISLSNQAPAKKAKTRKEDKIVASKATKQVEKKEKKDNPLLGKDPNLPDKALYDKAEDAIKHGRFDVGRLDLQVLLNTYPESQYMMRAKLAVADSWYKEGGMAALTQAEQEYKDFITFFPNSPEAAEAQMRVGDIYFREMDQPDRDYTTTMHAEQEYRLMLQQFPESTLVPQAQQKLREVQEVMAGREAKIGTFYLERQPPNYPAAIARLQTVVESYPLYSHMDDVLIGLGDAFVAEGKFIRSLRLPEAGKERLQKIYDDQAADAYRKVVLEYAAAPHVDDAKDRLVGMGQAVPTPTPEQLAASTALENSRGQYTLSKRALGFIMHTTDTVPAATLGAPPLEDLPPVSAATVVRKAITDFGTSMNPSANRPPSTTALAVPSQAPSVDGAAAPTPAGSPPLSFQDVPKADAPAGSGPAITNVPQSSPASSSGGTGLGIEIVRPGSDAQAPMSAPATPPAFPGTTPRTGTSDPAAGLGAIGAPNTAPLPPIEKPDAAPDPINEAVGTKQPAAQAPPAKGKKPKVTCDKADESCSKHKPKKGVGKLNPF
jgi:outer membrane protein assembly factor BamD